VIKLKLSHEVESVTIVDNEEPISTTRGAQDLDKIRPFAVFSRRLEKIRPRRILHLGEPPHINVLEARDDIIDDCRISPT
jgi:hypothetical protein